MGRKKYTGLVQRGEVWHIDKVIRGRRVCESTGTSDVRVAQEVLARRIDEIRAAFTFGVRPDRTFRAAATKFLNENGHKRSIKDDAWHLRVLDPFIGPLKLRQVHMGTLQAFIDARRKEGVKAKSINLALGCARRILNLAAGEWLDENGLTWLQQAPKIKLLPTADARAPYPLSFEEQSKLLQELPDHLARMALFKVNTGCRDQEVCKLRWDWEIAVPELETSVFVIPGAHVKNGQDRLVVLNRVAKSVVEAMRGQHPEYVFTYEGAPVTHMLNSAWKKARARAGLPHVRVHDLKHYPERWTMPSYGSDFRVVRCAVGGSAHCGDSGNSA